MNANEQHIFCLLQTGAGQDTLAPAEYEKKHGWKNDADRVKLMAEK